jgi:hypothetical protein
MVWIFKRREGGYCDGLFVRTWVSVIVFTWGKSDSGFVRGWFIGRWWDEVGGSTMVMEAGMRAVWSS